MPLFPGSRLGQYDILAKLGEGGMGQVYRARDSRLNRDVALKVLPESFVHDPERLSRFEREAQLLASLNHPNIAQIYEAGKADATAFLALELVPGPTLAERIARGPMPLDETLAIARQIVDALEAAHEQGVIHRDLKPANIKVREDGTVKVLDFGLAKAMFGSPGSEDPGLHNSPTLTARGTEMGLILGTAAYMSPEQAKGKTADRRADVWAFGVVLFEMLAGKQVFTGETASEVMASVMKEDANWSLLPANLPPALLRLLRRCLEKDPKKRMSAMSDVRLELNEKDVAVVASPAPSRSSRFGLIGAAIAGAFVTAIGFFVAAPALRSTPARETSRVSVLGPEGVTLFFDAVESAISPDGRTLVFTTADPNGTTRLWIRPLDALTAKVLDGTETGHMPFWSPDSQQIGFFANNKLKKTPAAGGTVQVLCEAPDGRGGTWGSRNIIVFAPASSGPLLQISGNGGDTRPATTLDAAKGETGHRFPNFLPDGRHFLFASLPAKNLQFDLFAASVDDSSRVPLLAAESAAVYADPGYLLFTRRGTLIAQPFNPSSLKLSGDPVGVSDEPSATAGQYASGRAVSVSTNGTMAYLGDRLPNTKLVWFDRSGRQTGTLAVPEGRYQEITISPDGHRASIVRFTTQNDSDIWIADLTRTGAATRFTTERGLNYDVVWSPDSMTVVFASDAPGRRTMFVKPASGATPEKTFYESPALFKDPHTWSPDGKFVAFEQLDPKTNRDIMYIAADHPADARPTAYLQTQFNDTLPAFSPDGKWLAYVSDESGHNEVYVDAFPTPRNKLKVTDSGATAPHWSKDGRELLMTGSDGKAVFVSDVTMTSGTITSSQPRKLFDFPKAITAVGVAPDNQKLLTALDVTDNTTSTLTVVFNWLAAIKQK